MSWIQGMISVGLTLLVSVPLAAKWELGVRRVGVAMASLSAIWVLLISRIGRPLPASTPIRVLSVWAMAIASGLGLLAYRFYRDPEREIPDRDDVILSPADGTVLYVRESQNGMIPVSSKNGRSYSLEELAKTKLQSGDAYVIGIAMNFLDVHVNRAPIRGHVSLQRHFPGTFASLKNAQALTENERATTVIERDDLQVGVVQIASRLVRQIVSYVKEGEDVVAGQRIGVIRFGSQVDLIIPKRDRISVMVEPGEYVTAGETMMAKVSPELAVTRNSERVAVDTTYSISEQD